jgi:oxygen-independent coproporphyrinogen-3 oxidase
VEEGTPFYDMELDLPEEEEERRMYESAAEILSGYGYKQYEISNYAKPGRECRHNTVYWTGREYVGFGIAAASFFENERFANTDSMEEYLSAGDYAGLIRLRRETLSLSLEERMSEFVILGLRMNRGVKDGEFFEKFECHLAEIFRLPIETHVKNELLWKNEAGDIGLTQRGRNLSNYVMKDFLI